MPEQWMDEVRGQEASSRAGYGHGGQNERMRGVQDMDERRRPGRAKYVQEEEEEDAQYQIPFLRFGITFLLAVIATAITLYYGKFKTTPTKPKLRPVSTFGVVEGNLSLVYEYLSTPEYRTEWHMAASEITGPDLDHSAVPGEVFSEECRIADKDVLVQWAVVDRQFPSTPDTKTAEFVLGGAAQLSRSVTENWKETFRLKGGLHHFAKTPQVHVEIELLLVDDDFKPLNKQQKKWRKKLQASVKESLAMLRMRVDELLALRQKVAERRQR